MDQLGEQRAEARADTSGNGREGTAGVSEEVAAARIERWLAQDRVVILERIVAGLEEELAERDDRLRRLTDEWLLEKERRHAAEATAQHLLHEAAALRTTLWWRLGRFPRWVRRHLR